MTAKVRSRFPMFLHWEDTRTATFHAPTGDRFLIAYQMEHIWTTWNQWLKLAIDRADWYVRRIGWFVLAYRVMF